MINKYDNFNELKNEIEKFISIIKLDIRKNDLIYLAKMIIFLKQIIYNLEDTYYGCCMLSDIFELIHLLNFTSKRLFYMVYRSQIENSLRIICELKMNDSTGVNELVRKTQLICGNKANENYSYIKHQYKIGCNYTHSNIKNNCNLYEYFNDTIYTDKPNKSEVQKLFLIELKYLEKYINLLIKIKPFWIDNAFYRENQKLKYLLSSSTYEFYSKYLKENC